MTVRIIFGRTKKKRRLVGRPHYGGEVHYGDLLELYEGGKEKLTTMEITGGR